MVVLVVMVLMVLMALVIVMVVMMVMIVVHISTSALTTPPSERLNPIVDIFTTSALSPSLY